MNSTSVSSGPLSGLTILRFAHAYETGGGVELHLRDLNRGLSLRNSLNTILVHLTKEKSRVAESIESIGESKLIKVPLQATAGAAHANGANQPAERVTLRQRIPAAMNLALFSSGINRAFVRNFLSRRKVPTRAGEAVNAGAITAELLRRHQVDLVVMHANGGSDASEVIGTARAAGVPIALIHHFSNDKLGNISVRQQVADVHTVAGASAIGLPHYVKNNFTNLSDAVNLDFFRVENARPVGVTFSTPVLFAPGRMTPDKGQMDALKVSIELRRRGIKHTLVFAGRVDDADFERALRDRVEKEGMTDDVHFAGELNFPQYRDWFKVANVMLMPTHHHEGMPRTLVDSQAMKVPPIVYDIGGTRDGVRHEKTGFLVPLGNIPAVTEHAAELLQNQARRNQMAADGRAFVEKEFSMDAFLARHEQFYLKTIAQSRRGARA